MSVRAQNGVRSGCIALGCLSMVEKYQGRTVSARTQ